MKLSREQLDELIPEDSIRAAFMRRDDIKDLPEDERERRWLEHVEKIQPFMNFLTQADCAGIIPKK